MTLMAALLAATLAAVPARAQTFEAAAAAAQASLAAKLKAGKPPPPPTLPKGTSARYQRVFDDGWREAVRSLSRKDCAAFFAARGAPAPKPLEAMQKTEYRFLQLPQGEGVGAQTNGSGSVFINTDGVFVYAMDGRVTMGRTQFDLFEPRRVRAMILLHELGHELGIFGADSGSAELLQQNVQHTVDIIHACVPGTREML